MFRVVQLDDIMHIVGGILTCGYQLAPSTYISTLQQQQQQLLLLLLLLMLLLLTTISLQRCSPTGLLCSCP